MMMREVELTVELNAEESVALKIAAVDAHIRSTMDLRVILSFRKT